MGKAEKAMFLLIYFIMLIFGGITVLTTAVIPQIATIQDAFTTFIFTAIVFLAFFILIPWFIWKKED